MLYWAGEPHGWHSWHENATPTFTGIGDHAHKVLNR